MTFYFSCHRLAQTSGLVALSMAAALATVNPAQANVLVAYPASPGAFQNMVGTCATGNAPTTVAAGVVASNLFVSKNCRDLGNNVFGVNINVQAHNTDLTATVGFGAGSGEISNFTFSEYNNDSAPGDQFELLGHVNNNTATVLGTFRDPAQSTSNYNFTVNQVLSPNDTYTFTIESLSGGVYTAQYFFENVQVLGTAVPEPSALGLIAVGLAALGWSRRNTRCNT